MQRQFKQTGNKTNVDQSAFTALHANHRNVHQKKFISLWSELIEVTSYCQ